MVAWITLNYTQEIGRRLTKAHGLIFVPHDFKAYNKSNRPLIDKNFLTSFIERKVLRKFIAFFK